jgi:site-specific recombinase XerD
MLESFTRDLRARNRSPRTIQSYRETVRLFQAFLADRGMPSEVTSIAREHVEAWIEDLLDRFRPATAAIRSRSLQQFFRWLVEDGEILESPMRRMHPPAVPEEPPPVLPQWHR